MLFKDLNEGLIGQLTIGFCACMRMIDHLDKLFNRFTKSLCFGYPFDNILNCSVFNN